MSNSAISAAAAERVVRAGLRGFATDDIIRGLGPDEPIRDVLELDSIDYLTFVERISTATGQRIEEDAYPDPATIGSWTAVLTTSG